MVGDLDAGNPHVQFDEGAQETCDSITRLCPTLPQPLAISSDAWQSVLFAGVREKPVRRPSNGNNRWSGGTQK
jgi:hypothetical protein